MYVRERSLIFGILCLANWHLSTASYRCGIRKHSFVQLAHHAWKAENGQWPWHTAIFRRDEEDGAKLYACGGSLISEKHVLTAAHCAVNRETLYPLPANKFELHFGRQHLSAISANVRIRDVKKVHVHPEHTTLRKDIAILVSRLALEFTDFIIPICLDQTADRDLRNLEGTRGWIAGWGSTETGKLSDELRTASFPVVSYLECGNDDHMTFGSLLSPEVFCAGDRNGTSPGTGDSGGGMFFSDGDRWVLRGIVSFGKADEVNNEINTSSFTVFVNVQKFLSWIREVVALSDSQANNEPKRISEIACESFKKLAKKRTNGICENSRYPHSVSIVYPDGSIRCNGVLVSERHVLTVCSCLLYNYSLDNQTLPRTVLIEGYGFLDIQDMACHPRNIMFADIFDVAVITLDASVGLSSLMIPACLPNHWTENLYDQLLITGYSLNIETSRPLLVVSNHNRAIPCEEIVTEKPTNFSFSGICVNNSDVFTADTTPFGGGLLQSVNTRSCMATAVGLLTFGLKNSTIFGFTRLSQRLDWIEHIVWNATLLETSNDAETMNTSTISTNQAYKNPDFVFPDDDD